MATSTSRRCATALLVTVAALELSTACATPQPRPAGGEVTVQVQTFSGNTFVSVSVNDNALATLFLVDTGATRTVVSPSYARRLGLDVPDDAPRRDVTIAGGSKLSVPFVRARSVAVGAARVPDLLIGVYDIFPNAPVVDGLLGTDFLGRYRVTFDPTQRTMHLAPTSVPAVLASQGAPRSQERAERADPGATATFLLALATPPVWKPGYEWAYSWRSTQGSGTFVWSVVREDVVDGIPLYAVKSGQREIFYRRSDLALYMERVNGATQIRWVPPLMRYSWPFTLGGIWEQTYTRERPQARESETRTVRCQIAEREERVTVPAGMFTAVRVACRFLPAGALSHESWYAPEVGHMVRDRTYSSDGVRERELTSFKGDAK
jgi:predicted aspartyl protease